MGKQNLATENDKLKDELAKLKFQLSVAQPTAVAAVHPAPAPTLAPPAVPSPPGVKMEAPTLLPMLSPILVPFNSAFYSIGGQGVLTPNTPLTSARGVRFSFPQVSPEALEAARKSSVSALAELSNTMAVL